MTTILVRWLTRTALALVLATALLPSMAAAADMAAGWEALEAKDYERAERIWLKDAERGDRNAAFGLGMVSDARRDAAGAAKWYERAARAGLPEAQVLIGQRYAEGIGVPKNLVMAYAWFTRAMAARVPNAGKVRARLAKEMSPEAIKEAESLAASLGAPN